MKGIVFTEFLDMVEKKFGYETVDLIITTSKLESNGIYTAVGTYPHYEIINLLMTLSDTVKIDPLLLLKEFGKYTFDTFLVSYPHFFASTNNSFDFLHSIDNHIHVEVLKLYPDATLPKFVSEETEDETMTLFYKSERKMGAFAEGLIEKSFDYYNEKCIINTKFIKEDGSEVLFTIKRLP